MRRSFSSAPPAPSPASGFAFSGVVMPASSASARAVEGLFLFIRFRLGLAAAHARRLQALRHLEMLLDLGRGFLRRSFQVRVLGILRRVLYELQRLLVVV